MIKFSTSLVICSAAMAGGGKVGGEGGGRREWTEMVGNFEHVKEKLVISHRIEMFVILRPQPNLPVSLHRK